MSEVEQEQAVERKPTERVVLKAETVVVLPLDVSGEQLDAVAAALHTGKGKPKGAQIAEAWVEVARHTAPTKTLAIEAHAGRPGTPDALVGTFRAPSVTAWKGAAVYNAPPLPLVERSVVD